LTLFSLLYSSFLYTSLSSPHIYTLSLHDALPISRVTSFASFIFLAPVSSTSNTIGIVQGRSFDSLPFRITFSKSSFIRNPSRGRSEEHTSELQSRFDLVCRLLLEKKKQKKTITMK